MSEPVVPEPPPEEEPLASVVYSVLPNGDLTINIHINDYSEETLELFSLLFASMPTIEFQLQGLEITKDAFVADGKEKEFDLFLARTLIKNSSMAAGIKEKGPDDPLISPIDLM